MKLDKKLKSFLTLENLSLFSASFLFALNTFFYFYLRVQKSSFLSFFGINKISFTYIILAIFLAGILKYYSRNSRESLLAIKKIIFVFFPMELVLICSYFNFDLKYENDIYMYTLRPFVGIYFILFGFYFVSKHKKYSKIKDFFKEFWKKNESAAAKGINKKSKFIKIAIIVSVIALNLGFGSYHIAEFAAVDEPLWSHGRIPKFWSNVADGEFQKTMVSDKPGITVAIISGVALNWVNPMYYKNSHWEGENLGNYLDTRDLNFSLRFPLLLFNCLMLLIFYFLIKKLSGETAALISLILIGLSPLLIGISIIINPDSLLWTFAPLSLIAYFVYLKNHENKYLYWCGIFLGFALLTKYVANILYVFFFGLIFLEYILNSRKYKEMGPANYFKAVFADYFTLIFFSLATFFVFLPAAWVNAGRVLEGTILSKAFLSIWPVFLGIIALTLFDIVFLKNKIIAPLTDFLSKYKSFLIIAINSIFILLIISTLADTYLGMRFYDLEAILASPKSSKTFEGLAGMMLANFYSLIFGLTPLAFLAMSFGSLSNIFPKKKAYGETTVWSTCIVLFIIFYYLASTISGVSATVRYQIILYPLAMILSGIGIYQFINAKQIKKYIAPGLVYLIVFIFSLYSLNSIKPFYFSYASDLLPRNYVLNLKDMGDGSYEAAIYLNNLPDAEKLVAWTDKRGVCAFFVGTCRSGFDFEDMEKIDYFVVSSGRESRTSKMTAGKVIGGDKISEAVNKFYSENVYDYKLEIGGRPNNFVKIISGEKLMDLNN